MTQRHQTLTIQRSNSTVLVELDNLFLISTIGCLPGDAGSQIHEYYSMSAGGLRNYNS